MKFSKALRHVDMKDVKKKRLQKESVKLKEQKKIKDEIIRNVEIKKYAKSAMEQIKYDWRSDIDKGAALREGMTTSDVATIATPANPDEVLNDTPLDNADDFAPGARGDVADFYNATVGTSIKSSGSGSGNNGGFDIGNHLAFDGDGSTDGARWMITQPVDTTNMDHIVMSIITGNDSNGGETPDDSGEGLALYYKTPQMNDFIPINYFPTFTGDDYRGGDIGYPDFEKLSTITDGPTFVDPTIIPVGGGSPTLQNYSKYIPSYARGKGTQFLLYQFASSGTGKDNYGVKNISYRRKTPIQVVAPLDNPEASSFIRGAEQGSTPKKRKKDVDDKLEASDEYTTAKFGNEFPGQEVRVGGEDPFKSAKIGDDVKPSPQTKERVKKGFNDFNNQATTVRGAPTAKPEAEPEPTTPSAQATMEPKTEDGEPIPVKTVGGRNSGAVQGADAAAVDAQNAQDDAQDDAQEPETTEPEAIDPDDIKPDPDETKDKTPEQRTQLEIDKKQEVLNSELTKLENELNNITPDRNGFFNYLSVLAGGVQTVLRLAGAITNLTSMITGKPKPRWFVEKDIAVAKIADSIAIARSQLTGKIIGYDPNTTQINEFIAGLTIGSFIDAPNMPASVPISSVRHEYADENIYVLDGKVYNNRDEKATDLTQFAFRGFTSQGQGYAQMIIPPDGGEPYVHYYDYSYNNLNNPEDIGGELKSMFSTLSDISLYLSSVPAFGGFLGKVTNPQKFMDGLKNTSSMEGWPAGIHGASLTDFKVPLSKLSSEVQAQIASHPLSWTPERMASMSEDYLYEQMDILLKKEGIVFKDSDSGDSYFKGIIKILNSKGINADPKFVEAFTGIDTTWKKGQELQKEYEEIPKKPGFGLAHEKAKEEWLSLHEDKKSATSREELNKYISKNVKIPNPATDGDDRPDWSEWIDGDKKEYDKFIAQQTKFADAAQDYYKNTYKPATDKLLAYQATLKREGNKVVGTEEQIAKFRELKTAYDNASNEYYRLDDLQVKPMNEAGALLSAFIKDYDRRMAIWKPYLKEIDRVYSEISDIFDMLISEAYEKYMITTGDENEDGVIEFVNGGDYTDEKGKTYPGYGRFYEDIDARIAENNELADQYWDTYDSYGYKYLAEKIDPFLVNKQFKGKTIDWTPGKKGTGNIPGGYRSDGAESRPRGSSYGGFDASFAGSGGGRSGRRNDRRGTAFNESNLYERLKNKSFFNPDDIKPEFPENPPPKLDPKTGMHPQYGKKAKRYGKLDSISANSMPPTGDPEIDAVVNKQKTINKIKKMARNK